MRSADDDSDDNDTAIYSSISRLGKGQKGLVQWGHVISDVIKGDGADVTTSMCGFYCTTIIAHQTRLLYAAGSALQPAGHRLPRMSVSSALRDFKKPDVLAV
jgi:hypothetical protein